jgi:hypothetical protein
MVKIVVPVFVDDEFLGCVGGSGLLLGDKGEVESFLVKKATGIGTEEIERLAKKIGHISMEDAMTESAFMAAEVKKIVAPFEKHRMEKP